MKPCATLLGALLLLAPGLAPGGTLTRSAAPELKSESFGRDPGWDGHNNRSAVPAPRTVRQDFGYRAASGTDGAAIGGVGRAPPAPASLSKSPAPARPPDRPPPPRRPARAAGGAGRPLGGRLSP